MATTRNHSSTTHTVCQLLSTDAPALRSDFPRNKQQTNALLSPMWSFSCISANRNRKPRSRQPLDQLNETVIDPKGRRLHLSGKVTEKIVGAPPNWKQKKPKPRRKDGPPRPHPARGKQWPSDMKASAPNLLSISRPSLAGFVVPMNGQVSAGNTEEITLLDGNTEARNFAVANLAPFSDSGPARNPANASGSPTFVGTDYLRTIVACYNGTTAAYDGSAAIFLRGEGYGNRALPNSISAGNNITWNAPVYSNLNTVCNTATVKARPLRISYRFTYMPVGEPHDISFHFIRLPPGIAQTTGFAAPYPLTTTYSCDTLQLTRCGGVDLILKAGQTVELHCTSYSAASATWLAGNAYRGDTANPACCDLSQFVVWYYGVNNKDMMNLDVKIDWEYYYLTADSTTIPPRDSAIVAPAPDAEAKARRVEMVAAGNGFDALWGVASDLSSKLRPHAEKFVDSIWSRVGDTLLSAVPSLLSLLLLHNDEGPRNFWNSMALINLNSPNPPKSKPETKDDEEFQEVPIFAGSSSTASVATSSRSGSVSASARVSTPKLAIAMR